MDVRNHLDGLKSLLDVASATPTAAQQPRGGAAASATTLGSDQVTFSSAASEAAQAAGDSGVRMDKVAAIQAALAAGTYNVSASAVASKVVDSMLGGE